MPSRTETKVEWSGANSAVVAPSGTALSDPLSLDQTCIKARIALKADNQAATPNADDIVVFYVRETSGDPDGIGTDEFDSPNHGTQLRSIDTNRDDPAQGHAEFPVPQKAFQIYAEGLTNQTVNNITVSATITELREP